MLRHLSRGLRSRSGNAPLKFALWPGDGIGVEVTHATVQVLDAVENIVDGYASGTLTCCDPYTDETL